MFPSAFFQNRNSEDVRYQVLQLASLRNVQASRSQEKEQARGHRMIIRCCNVLRHILILKNFVLFLPTNFHPLQLHCKSLLLVRYSSITAVFPDPSHLNWLLQMKSERP